MTNVVDSNWHPLFKDLDIGVALVDKNGEFLKANPFFCELVEYNHSELLEKTSQEITHPSDLKADKEMSRRTALKEIPGYRMTKRYITKTNKVAWVEVIVLGITNGEVKMFFLQALPIDVTDKCKTIPKVNSFTLMDVFQQNKKTVAAAFIFCVSTIIGLGIAFWTGINHISLLSNQVSSLSKDVSNNRTTIMKMVDDEITKQKKILEEIRENSKEE